MRSGTGSSVFCLVLVIILAGAGCEAIFAPIASVLAPREFKIRAEVKVSRGDSIAIALVDARERQPRGERPFTGTFAQLIKSELDMHTRAESSQAAGQAAELAADGRLAAAADAAGTDFFLLGRVTTLEPKAPGSIGFLRGTIEVEVSVYNAREDGVAYSGRITLHHPELGERMIGDLSEERMIEILLGLGARDIGRLFYDYKISRSERNKRLHGGTD